MTGEVMMTGRPVAATKTTPSTAALLIEQLDGLCDQIEGYSRTTAAICNRIGIMYDQAPAGESSETAEGFIGAFNALLRRLTDSVDDLGNRIVSIDEAF